MPRVTDLTIARSRSEFAARLRRLRLGRGLTQKDLEHASGIPKSRISRYENGHVLPSFRGLRRLAQSLSVSDEELLGDGGPAAAFVAALKRHGIEVDSIERADEIASIVADTLSRERSRPKKTGERGR